jgi:hypothetical protein
VRAELRTEYQVVECVSGFNDSQQWDIVASPRQWLEVCNMKGALGRMIAPRRAVVNGSTAAPLVSTRRSVVHAPHGAALSTPLASLRRVPVLRASGDRIAFREEVVVSNPSPA